MIKSIVSNLSEIYKIHSIDTINHNYTSIPITYVSLVTNIDLRSRMLKGDYCLNLLYRKLETIKIKQRYIYIIYLKKRTPFSFIPF